MADYADCLANWLHAIGVDRPHVLGLSWGSSLALELARRHSEVPRSLILASAYAGWRGSLPATEVAARLEAVLAAADLPRDQLITSWQGLLTTAASPELADELGSIWADNSAINHPGGYRAMAHSMAEADLRDVLPRINVSTLLVYGELDLRAPLAIADQLHAGIPASKLVVLPGVGHMCNAEGPDEFNGTVREFLRSVA